MMYWPFKNEVTLELELSSKTVITALTQNPECGHRLTPPVTPVPKALTSKGIHMLNTY